MNAALPPQLRENLAAAGDPARWFLPGAAGETVRPEVVETLLPGLTPELVPALVREARPEGPARKQALAVALRQRLATAGTVPYDKMRHVPVLPVNESPAAPPAYLVDGAGQLVLSM